MKISYLSFALFSIQGALLLVVPIILSGIWLGVRQKRWRKAFWASVAALFLAGFGNLFSLPSAAVLAGSAALTYQGVTFMESAGFCGQTCHAVMQPEYEAHRHSAHANVECAACHVGPGASWFLKSKLEGLREVFATAFHTYQRPIPSPIHKLRPAREICESCHWPEKFGENRVRIVNKFADDEANSSTKTVLLMRVGRGPGSPGIHGAHLGAGVEIHYSAADEARQTILQVDYRNSRTGRSAVYMESGAGPEKLKNRPTRLMDCMDCHNRPAHVFELPDRAVDNAMSAGAIPASLPLIKKKSIELLRKNYKNQDEASIAIPAGIERFYKESRAALYAERRAEIAQAANAIVAIYKRNVFPDMNVGWGTYANNLGHADYPGCFRCHDDQHASAGGKRISQDCNACHQLLAVEEPSPTILSHLGMTDTADRSY